MGIDINSLRSEKGGNPEEVRDSEIRRFRDGQAIDDVINIDNKWRNAIFLMENTKKECNAANKEIGQRKKKCPTDKCEELLLQSQELKKKIPELEATVNELESEREVLLNKIGNMVHPSVVVSNDESENKILKKWGIPWRFDEMNLETSPPSSSPCEQRLGKLHHHEIFAKLNGYDCKKGVEIAGHRGYFLKGVGVMLNMALVQYGVNFLIRRGYLPVQPPFFMRRDVMSQTAELKDFEETLYRIPVDEGKDEKDDLFLIATSEQPISALHRNEWIEEKSMPIRYAGSSSCFRKEAGSHGKDTWGLFRIHQFEKVEQFCITKPEDSWEMHEEMIQSAEEFYQSLELPYRVVSIVSGALNDAAAKKYDLEAWFPGYDDYRELVSCSNCTDYQSRSLDIRLGHKKQGEREKRYVHMLNATLVATQRCMCCIVENYQTKYGIKVPRVLIPYMGGLEFIKYPTDNSAQDCSNTATSSSTTTATTANNKADVSAATTESSQFN